MSNSPKLNRDETARDCGISTASLDRMRKSKTGPPYVRLGSRIVYDRQSVNDWLLAQEQQ